MPHTVISLNTGKRSSGCDYVKANSFALARNEVELMRTFYGPEYRFTVAIIANDGTLIPLPEFPFPAMKLCRPSLVSRLLSFFHRRFPFHETHRVRC